MPTIPSIGQMAQPAQNPLAAPSQADLLTAAASMPTQADVAKGPRRKPKGKGK